MLCEAGKGICPHCVKADVLPWEWRKRGWGSSAAVPPALGNWLCNKGRICRVSGGGVAMGSGKSTERGSIFWQIALNHQDCLQESFFVFAGNCTFCVQFCLKRFIFRQLTRTHEFCLGVRLVCDFQTFEVFSSFTQLLFADLPSAD